MLRNLGVLVPPLSLFPGLKWAINANCHCGLGGNTMPRRCWLSWAPRWALIADVPAVFWVKLASKIPMKLVHTVAAIIFAVPG